MSKGLLMNRFVVSAMIGIAAGLGWVALRHAAIDPTRILSAPQTVVGWIAHLTTNVGGKQAPHWQHLAMPPVKWSPHLGKIGQ